MESINLLVDTSGSIGESPVSHMIKQRNKETEERRLEGLTHVFMFQSHMNNGGTISDFFENQRKNRRVERIKHLN